MSIATDKPGPRTWGGVSFPNPNDDPVVIETFRIVPPLGGGMRLIESSMSVDENRRTLQAAPFEGYPAPPPLDFGELRPVRGTVIPPGAEKGGVLVLGVEVTRPGIFWWDRVDVDFRYKGRSYTVTNNLGEYVCTPKTAFPGETCPGEPGQHPREMCKIVGYVPLGDNGCVPPG